MGHEGHRELRSVLCDDPARWGVGVTGSSGQCSVMTQRGGTWGSQGALEGWDVCLHVADSLCCAAETNSIVLQRCRTVTLQ